MSRWKAAAVHLSISIAVGLLSAALVFGVWYPPPYSHAAGADELVLLLLGVDVVLGPLLTLAVFKVGKKGLRFDLGVIALLQICAFSYGMSVVVRARPAFIAALPERFVLVTATELADDDLVQGSKPEFRRIPWTGPQLVGTRLPSDVKERNDLLFSGVAGKDVDRFPKYYVDYALVAPEIRAKPLDTLVEAHPDEKAMIDAWLQRHSRQADSVTWLPLKTQRAFLTMLLDRNDGTPLDALPIDP